ncbi:MFS transporter [Patescibacteria group bacterium]|jgi:DHA1 family multidrug resistance protein-like MFS transporter|nr:MFS transporter [Patescibacteria group bacterium]
MSARTPLSLFALGALLGTITSVGGWLLAPIESVYLSRLTDNEFLIGLTFALGSIASALLALYLGRLSDRLGRKRILLVGLALGVVFPLIYSFAINIVMYMGGKLLWATTAVAAGPLLGAYLQSLVQGLPQRGHYLSLYYSAMSLSGALGHFLGGYITDVFSFTATFFTLAGIYAIATFVAWFILHEDVRPGAHLEEAEESEPRDLFFGIRYIFTRTALIYYFILNSSFAIAYKIKLLLWPLIVFQFTESAQVMGTIFAMTGVVAFLILLRSGKVVDRFGPYVAVHIAFTSGIVGGVLMGTADGVWLFALGAFFFTVAEAFYGSAQGVLLIDHVENRYRGEILGVDHIFDRVLGAGGMLLAGGLMVLLTPQDVWLLLVGALTVSYLGASWYRVFRLDRFTPVSSS